MERKSQVRQHESTCEVSPQRSSNMARIKGTNTKPELALRRGLHRLGLRFRLYEKTLPGRPDIVFAKRRAIILVHGCFWHKHDCNSFRWPATRRDFWFQKLCANAARDRRYAAQYDALDMRVLTVWECALGGKDLKFSAEVIDFAYAWVVSEGGTCEIAGPISFTQFENCER